MLLCCMEIKAAIAAFNIYHYAIKLEVDNFQLNCDVVALQQIIKDLEERIAAQQILAVMFVEETPQPPTSIPISLDALV